MKKILLLALALLTLPMPSFCETDAQTVQFLEKLNLYYYCLTREGLKGFTCDVSLIRPEKEKKGFPKGSGQRKFLEAMDQVKYTASVSPEGAVTVEPVLPEPSGDDKQDMLVKNLAVFIKNTIYAAFNGWVEIVVKPSYDQVAFARNCKVENGPKGFKVIQLENGEESVEYYDKNAKLLNATMNMDSNKFDVKADFLATDKGFLLSGLKLSTNGVTLNVKYEHETVERFWLLKNMKVSMVVPGAKGLEDVSYFSFSNYRLNQ